MYVVESFVCLQILERLSSIALEVHIARDTCQVKPDTVCLYLHTSSGRVQIPTYKYMYICILI